jgi:hypothetical protein
VDYEAALDLQASLYRQFLQATERAIRAERRIEELEAETPRERAARQKAERKAEADPLNHGKR